MSLALSAAIAFVPPAAAAETYTVGLSRGASASAGRPQDENGKHASPFLEAAALFAVSVAGGLAGPATLVGTVAIGGSALITGGADVYEAQEALMDAHGRFLEERYTKLKRLVDDGRDPKTDPELRKLAQEMKDSYYYPESPDSFIGRCSIWRQASILITEDVALSVALTVLSKALPEAKGLLRGLDKFAMGRVTFLSRSRAAQSALDAATQVVLEELAKGVGEKIVEDRLRDLSHPKETPSLGHVITPDQLTVRNFTQISGRPPYDMNIVATRPALTVPPPPLSAAPPPMTVPQPLQTAYVPPALPTLPTLPPQPPPGPPPFIRHRDPDGPDGPYTDPANIPTHVPLPTNF